MRLDSRMAADAWPPAKSIDFFDDVHVYEIDGKPAIASCTAISNFDNSAAGEYKMERIEATKADWEPRGNTVHKAWELFWTTGEKMTGTPYQEWIDPLLNKFDSWKDYECLASEYRCALRPERIAGSVDTVLRHKPSGKVILCDLKTKNSNSVDRSAKLHWAAQLGGYDLMIKRERPEADPSSYVIYLAVPGKVHPYAFKHSEISQAWEGQRFMWSKMRETF